ncbi:hypothetical protein SKAU_G00312460 [Synaphobranchus kaupii]|uniref:Uncharacterized protein n=1 Tax=Synaphobranchus kaupii TaxID=118154 RepID=A0A9Q1ILC9_SYNKA|nr:hypothetical protein SKAU_G00312460 [Synaphobranchus kaupii]
MHTNTHASPITHAHTHIHIHTHTQMHTNTHASPITRTHTHTHTHTHIHRCTQTLMPLHHAYTHTHTHTHTHIHIHRCTQTLMPLPSHTHTHTRTDTRIYICSPVSNILTYKHTSPVPTNSCCNSSHTPLACSDTPPHPHCYDWGQGFHDMTVTMLWLLRRNDVTWSVPPVLLHTAVSSVLTALFCLSAVL